MIGVIKTVLIIIGLWVVFQFISRLISSSSSSHQNAESSSGSARGGTRKKDDNKNDGEYIEYEEFK